MGAPFAYPAVFVRNAKRVTISTGGDAHGAAYTVICLTDDGIALIYEHQGVMQTIWHPKEELLRCTVGGNGNALRLYLKNDRHCILRNLSAAVLAQQMHDIRLL